MALRECGSPSDDVMMTSHAARSLVFWGGSKVTKEVAFARGFKGSRVVWRFLSTFLGFQKAWYLCNPWCCFFSDSHFPFVSGVYSFFDKF